MNLEAMDPSQYDAQLEQKRLKLKQAFARFTPPALEVFPSAQQHYRMRAEFRVWHDGDDLYYYMFDQQQKAKVRCDQFLPASALINQMMPALMAELRPNSILRHKLFQVDFLSTLSGEILVSLLYHKQLDDNWLDEAKALKQRLGKAFKVDIIGRARKQKFVLDRDFVIERLQVNQQEYIYKQVENSFTQPNAQVATKMLEWAIDCTRHSSGDLLELYCGNGNFSIALAQNFNKVLATELAKPSVDSAQYNIEQNGTENLQIIRMSAEEFTQAMTGERSFRRLEGIDLKSYDCNTIFVDPPRAGLDPDTVNLVQGYESILYISCNPQTLADNLEQLSQTHEIKRFALFDQFPYTDHMEAGVLLSRKSL
ncbi:tRNA (uridine(54)-C5)-methyltransferase TrmA [Shewanella algae]|uniref:tRNA (uridine(54)-C5)-methyltransferase TrmA n=1 Tax=Shewanella algae TaxID=38313 RepID=UPI001F26B76C|nr:tRNA (uridine(54)-C5)-methyltransferase TrmA [Shewanella algae]MCE9778641.1 tRNA (uridine(54)-C5)-methyltransferase TrmA [Shewanella algae]MCE9827402.1 tRNA (uridine(54)-C5)-methyltransferase TrmA [Shewanella algae]